MEVMTEVTYGTGDFEKDMKDVIELCGTWWKDSLFFKKYGIEYAVDDSLFRALKDFGLIYTCGRINGGRSDGEIISCYVGIKSPYMFNPNVQTANEIVWCVHKEHRSFRTLVGLMKAIDDLMDKNDIKLSNIVVSNEEKYESTGKFLENRGYIMMDKMYSYYKGDNHG